MSALRVEPDGPLLRITMARPERRNAFDASLIAELTGAFADVGDARGVVLAGDGPSFSAGADVEWMRASVELTYDENVADALRLRAMLDAIDGCPAPVVARVQGHALGGGCGLVACADIVISAPDTQFAFSGASSHRPGRSAGRTRQRSARRSAPLVHHRRTLQPKRLRIGLISEVADDLDDAVERVAAELVTAGPNAARAAKELARAPQSADETARRIAAHRTSDEGQEGLRAFLEKRPPSWRD